MVGLDGLDFLVLNSCESFSNIVDYDVWDLLRINIPTFFKHCLLIVDQLQDLQNDKFVTSPKQFHLLGLFVRKLFVEGLH